VEGKPDVIVVGGGSAGCVLASRLSENPDCEVLLLEAGPDLRAEMPEDIRDGWLPTRSFDWGFATETDEHGVSRNLPRGRLLGGCSSTNATFALRGSPADYDAWAGSGISGWSFEDVLPLFKRLESDADFGEEPWHGDAGPIPIRRYRPDELTEAAAAALSGFEALGVPSVADHNAPGAVGAGPLPVNCRDRLRVSTALAYLPEPGEPANLELRCDAEVAEVVFNGSRAGGVRLLDGTVIEGGHVVLCAGALGSPVLLLRSGVGPAEDLADLDIPVRVDLPGVGSNLADHPSVSVNLPYGEDPEPAPHFQVVATFHSSESAADDPPDLHLFIAGPYAASGESPPELLIATALLKPRSRGALRLRSATPTDPPRIELGYLREETDVMRLIEGLARAEELAAHPALRSQCAEARPDDLPPAGEAERRDWVHRTSWTYHHLVGTCAMGSTGDPAAVVDPGGRVRGTEGLFVVDASIMPDVPSANTLIPTLMVAEGMAERIGAELR
jgi:choline dehydrogenase